MDSIGVFHLAKKDGKPFELVYYHPKYHPIPQLQDLASSVKEGSQDYFIFLCPIERYHKDYKNYKFDSSKDIYPVISFPEYVVSKMKAREHSILPLFWCNNKEFDYDNDYCLICNVLDFGTSYYFCEYCDRKYHKECVESPVHIRHPYHLEHSLQLHYYNMGLKECIYCGVKVTTTYYCTTCNVFMHAVCAMKSIPFVVDKPKRHDHPLTVFPRQTSLICNVCGLLRKSNIIYICAECNFVTHSDCMYSPNIIKISRHRHRISYSSSLPTGEWSCGLCHQSIDSDYGAYTCTKCDNYIIHSCCALRKDVCDGIELEGVPIENDIIQEVQPFNKISEGVIIHFLHNHPLQLEVNILYDENKFCQACGLSIFECNIYSCVECDFIIHETCAKAHHIIQHALHPHPLTLRHINHHDDYASTSCDACYRFGAGFIYNCHLMRELCNFDLDVQCASISEPFHYKYHEHLLFLASGPTETPICHLCGKCFNRGILYCIKCDFILCMKCATLPEKVRYKYDKHFLKIKFGKEVCEKDWCEVCERVLGDTNTKMLYSCDDCCTAIHIECLFGGDPYMKPGEIGLQFGKVQVFGKRNNSRPLCDCCKNRCQGKILKRNNLIVCSMKCAIEIFK